MKAMVLRLCGGRTISNFATKKIKADKHHMVTHPVLSVISVIAEIMHQKKASTTKSVRAA